MGSNPLRSFDVTADGERILGIELLTTVEALPMTEIQVVLNFFEELRAGGR